MDSQLQKLEKDILRRIKEDISLNFDNPLDALKSYSDIILKYSNILYRLRKKLTKVTMNVRRKYSEIHKHLKTNSNYLLKNKQDVESFINTDEDYFKMKLEEKELKDLVSLIEDTMSGYRSKDYNERLIIKIKMNNGELQ